MEYQVIARKWRPQTFNDVVGQGHITRTLTNAVIQGRTAHAYLFVGPRGIGKTSSARIFAKALNCLSPVEGEPCCQCASCLSIAANSCMDIIEIDAASNNSVSSMRELCDEVMYAPVSSKYKIYIIDEVHMLTAASWNALLKTVEEPPEHVKFIFATTEVHKVLPTILSRCQRFDLRRIPSSLICERLRFICDTEKVPISDGALIAIARAADGGMRDAQSLLDQMISFFSASNDSQISEEQVLSLFGLTASVEMESLVQAILVNDRGTMITNIYQLANKGKDLEKLLEEVMTFLRGIQICQILPDPTTVIESGAESVTQYQRLGQSARAGVVQRLLEVLSPVGYTLHSALNKQVYLETILLKAMRVAHAAQVDDVIARLNQIRKNGELEVLDQVPNIQPAVEPAPVVQSEVSPVAPVQEVVTPVQEVVTPVQEVVAPVEHAVAPVEHAVAPVEHAVAPVEHAVAPVQEVVAPVEQPAVESDTQIQPHSTIQQPSAVSPDLSGTPDVALAQSHVGQEQELTSVQVEDDIPPWKIEDSVAPVEPAEVVAEEPELIENFSKTDELGGMPIVESVEQQIEVLEEIEHQHAAPAPLDLAASIPSADSIDTRDDAEDNVNPLADALKNEPETACHCVENNTIHSSSTSDDIVTENGTLTPYPGDTTYHEPCAEANKDIMAAEEVPDMAKIDFNSIEDSAEGAGHFDEVAHMENLKNTAAANPLVSTTIDMFSGEIVDIHSTSTPQV